MPEIQIPPPNPDAAAHAEAAQAETDRLAAEQTDALGETVLTKVNRPLSFGGVDYPVGSHAIPREALEADSLIEQRIADGDLEPGETVAVQDGNPTAVVRNKPAAKRAKR